MPRPTVDQDKREFLRLLHECGGYAGNVTLRSNLGWEGDRYWRTHASLLDEGKIDRGKGKGGSVSFVESSNEVEAAPNLERALYARARDTIEQGWCKERAFDEFIAEVTAHPGRQRTGGTWTRPDISVLATRAFPYIPSKAFEIVTFEIKNSNAVNVQGVFEALSHSQFASISYVVYCTNGRTDYPDQDRILRLAKDHGIGVIAAANVETYEEWEELVEPRRNIFDPEQANLFIGTSFSDDAKDKVMKWQK
jgi:hypothetical protein